jgi:hypothetical protein
MISHSDTEQGCIGMLFLLFFPPTFLGACLQTSRKFGPIMIASHSTAFRFYFRASKRFTWTEELVMRAACWERWPKCLPPWAIASWWVVLLPMRIESRVAAVVDSCMNTAVCPPDNLWVYVK